MTGQGPETLVVSCDPAWPLAYEHESHALRVAIGPALLALHHIGSTAVPGLVAKLIIDMMGVVRAPALMDSIPLDGLGYEALGAFGIKGRRYFRKRGATGRRT